MSSVGFRPFAPEDALNLRLQASQLVELGIDSSGGLTMDQARDLVWPGTAWTAARVHRDRFEILCCAGFREQFPGKQAIAWALLGAGIRAGELLAITRFARQQIAGSGLARIECLTADRDAERQWAELVGMRFNTLLHGYGAASETVCLYERVKL